jgi:hypothetical protein
MTTPRGFRSWLSVLALAAALIPATPASAATDGDQDGVADAIDNCVQTANPDQRDTDSDGFGNLCDGDLNNDGFVNALDLGLFKKVFLARSADADFNGDGVVNSLDLGLFKPLYALAPGPSNVRLSPALAQSPPAVSHVDVYTTDRVLPDGSDGAAFYTFGKQSVCETVSMVLGRPTAFNDLGIEPDVTAGDGVYSAFVKLDSEGLQSNEQAYIQRLANSSQTVTTYSGRDVTGSRKFSVPAGAAAAAIAPALTLPSGVVLTLINLRLTNLVPLASTITPAHSLTITDRSVVADPTRTFDPCDVDGDNNAGNVNGVWSFKTLMANMANTSNTGITTAQFINNWLLNWMSPQTVGTSPFTIMPRPSIKTFFPPSSGSPTGWDGVNASTLDIDNLPFRLLAIVNRMDLAGTAVYGQPANAKKSETRFVFGLVDRRSTNPGCKLVTSTPGNVGATLRMTVIFEMGDPVANCQDLQTRAQAWIALSAMPLPSATFNMALEALTNGVTMANAQPTKPNGSALDQLRTNEIALMFPWQLREFGLTAPFSSLVSATIKQTPDPGMFRVGSALTAQFWQMNADAILCETHQVTDTFMGMPFLGTHADYGTGTAWNTTTSVSGSFPSCWQSNVSSVIQPTKDQEVRHKFSLNTCDDCHSGETNTQFVHVDPQSSPAALSGFLTGITVSDPGGAPVQRTFNDLQRRAQSLEDQAQGCLKLPFSFAIQQARLTNIH